MNRLYQKYILAQASRKTADGQAIDRHNIHRTVV